MEESRKKAERDLKVGSKANLCKLNLFFDRNEKQNMIFYVEDQVFLLTLLKREN